MAARRARAMRCRDVGGRCPAANRPTRLRVGSISTTSSIDQIWANLSRLRAAQELVTLDDAELCMETS